MQVQLINDAYNLVIDAMLGPEADCDEIKEPYSGILVTLKQIKTPIVSVDVPSGECFHPAARLRGSGARWTTLPLREAWLPLQTQPGSAWSGPRPSLGAHVRRINLTLCSLSP